MCLCQKSFTKSSVGFFFFFFADSRIDTSSSLFSESTIMPTTYVQVLRIYYVTTDSITSYPVVPPTQVTLFVDFLLNIASRLKLYESVNDVE